MSEIKWIKLSTDIFDNRKIKILENLPEGDTIIVIWIKLLCLAGSCNESGTILLTKEIPYTEQMLATIFGRKLSTIKLALRTFQEYNMIEIVDNFINISNWEKYQSVDKMEIIKEQNRQRVKRFREKQRLNNSSNLEICNVTCNANVMQCNDVDIDINKDINKDIYISIYLSGDQKNEISILAHNYLPEVTERQIQLLYKLASTYGYDLLIEAMNKTASRNDVNDYIAYVRKIVTEEYNRKLEFNVLE